MGMGKYTQTLLTSQEVAQMMIFDAPGAYEDT